MKAENAKKTRLNYGQIKQLHDNFCFSLVKNNKNLKGQNGKKKNNFGQMKLFHYKSSETTNNPLF